MTRRERKIASAHGCYGSRTPAKRTLDTALTALATGKYQGIGFMLSHSPFSGIDLDHSVEGGTLVPWAKAIVEAMDTYGDYSPSWNKAAGTGGVHLLVEGKRPRSKKVGNIEI